MPTLANNRRSLRDYQILDEIEAGLVLDGHEVKAIRNGLLKLTGSYVTIANGQPRLINAHISRYPKAGKLEGYDPDRTRQLLLHKREISRLAGKLDQKGLTLVPISVYTGGPKIKLKFGLARGKKEFEKREQKKKRDIERDLKRDLKNY